MSDQNTPTFHLGLVLAGAVSGGAYTAGVLDFLFEALDAFEAARQRPDCPNHQVRIHVMTGTSAGAMCVGLSLRALLERELDESPLYEAWVKRISARQLLALRDLESEKPVVSMLDSSVLDDIARDVLPEPKTPLSLPKYVSDPLSLGMCTAQTRGVPYSVGMVGSGCYEMRLHAAQRWFHVRGADRALPWWDDLRDTCIASGAFPLGLAPRKLSIPRAEYEARQWIALGPEGPEVVQVRPSWPDEDPRFLSFHVDGGIFDNEPLELARARLSNDPLQRNPREGDKASRALIMVDPFLEVGVDPPPTGPLGLVEALPKLVAAMIQNARFKPSELLLALDETIYSRFVVAPRRTEGRASSEWALASGVLGAFGGFLSEKFRNHDYRLGRRNCQEFLRRSFALYASNPIVRDWSADAIRAHEFRDREGDTGPERAFRPLIPLFGKAAVEVARPGWPQWTGDEEMALRRGLAERSDAVVGALVNQHATNPLVRLGLHAAWKLTGWAARARLMEIMNKELIERRLALGR